MPESTPTVGPQSGDDTGKVGVMLAHSLNPIHLANIGLPIDTASEVGDVIVVDRPTASSLIGAGLVQVDPSDRVAVAAILDGEAASTAVDPSATSGNTSATASLTGDALDEALRKRGLPVEGKADEKRAAIAAFDATLPAAR